MADVVFAPQAKTDLTEIGDYIAFQLHNKSAARRIIAQIRKTVMGLQRFPEMGTPLLHVPVTYRYLISGNYMIFYHLDDGNACVDRILYGRRDYLSLLFGDQLEEENE